MIEIRETSAISPEAVSMLAELNAALTKITGASGEGSFSDEDAENERSAFVVAYADGVPYGCGALRPFTETAAEVKRVYARPNTQGVGTAIIKALEAKAQALGYTRLVLETRRVNTAAIAFYHKLGFSDCPNFGKYTEQETALCMAKKL